MTSSPRNISSLHRADAALLWTLRGLAAVAGIIVVLIVVFLVLESWPALRTIGPLRFLRDQSWYPLSDQFNMIPMVVGSLAVTLGAIVLAAPLGIGSALFCRYYAPRPIAGFYRRLVQILAGIPSVVFGFWGLVVWVPLVTQSLLAGILILALMILPTVALLAETSLAAVPTSLERGAAALGLTRWAMIRRVMLPAARSGIVTSIILAIGRAIGETMAVVMVCGNVVQLPDSLLAPIRTLTANIALEMSYAGQDHRSALFVSGLLLMFIVMLLVALAQRISRETIHA